MNEFCQFHTTAMHCCRVIRARILVEWQVDESCSFPLSLQLFLFFSLYNAISLCRSKKGEGWGADVSWYVGREALRSKADHPCSFPVKPQFLGGRGKRDLTKLPFKHVKRMAVVSSIQLWLWLKFFVKAFYIDHRVRTSKVAFVANLWRTYAVPRCCCPFRFLRWSVHLLGCWMRVPMDYGGLLCQRWIKP